MQTNRRLALGFCSTLALIAGCQNGQPGQLATPLGLTLERVETLEPGPVGNVAVAQTRAASQQSAKEPPAPTAATRLDAPPGATSTVSGPTYSGSGTSASGPGPQTAGTRATGQLTIDLHGFLAAFSHPTHRRLLETVQDIAKIVITVQENGAPDQTATLTQADIANDAVTHTFNNLPIGNGIISVIAYDAQNNPIGSASQVVRITASQTAVADLTVQLVASSSSPGPGGTLAANVHLVPAPIPTPPGTVLATYATEMPVSIVPDPTGKIFVHTRSNIGGGGLGQWQAKTQVIDTAGQVTTFKTFRASTPTSTYALVRDPANNRLWASSNDGTYLVNADASNQAACTVKVAGGSWDGIGLKLGPAGTALAVSGETVKRIATDGTVVDTSVPAAFDVAADSLGNLWTNWRPTPSDPLSSSVRKYTAAGTLVGEYPLPFAPVQLATDSADNLWVVGDARNPAHSGNQVAKISPLGALLATANIQARSIAFDAAGQVWAAGPQLVKLDSNAAVVATYPVVGHVVAIDGNGFVWVGGNTNADGSFVKKVMP